MIHAARMPRYVILVNWTDQGIRTAKDAPKRVEDFKNLLKGQEVKW